MNIILSHDDPVSRNVSGLLSLRYILSKNVLDCSKKADLNLFITKHESSSKMKCFSCHSTGNFGKADFGGEDFTLSYSNALVQSACVLKLKELLKPLKLDKLAVIEATHHGPSNDSCNLFLEIGSTDNEYNNLDYCAILVKVADYLFSEYESIMKSKARVAVCIGGGHYAYNFTKRVSGDFCIGHICPEYQLRNLSKGMLGQMIEKTVPKPSIVLVDKNVFNEKILGYCKELGIDCEVI
jgi:D-aminoacyl-tRNA deacylase